MPSASEIAAARLRVAGMIGCSTGILLTAIYALAGGQNWLAPSVKVQTYMADLSGLQKGATVRFNGIDVGKVDAAALSHLNDPNKVVRVDMSVMERYLPAIPEDSTVAVAADNVLGDSFVDINEGKSPQHLRAGGELVTPPQQGVNMGDLMKAARQIVGTVDSTLSDIEAGRGDLGKFVKGEEFYDNSLAEVTAIERKMRAATSQDTLAGRLLYDEKLYDQLSAPIRRLNDTLDAIEKGQGQAGKWLKDSSQYDELRRTIGRLNRSLEDLRAGKGPAGKLLADDAQYRRLVDLIDGLNRQVDALNASRLLESTDLYERLEGSSRQLAQSLAEFRRNPKKYLRLKAF